MKRTRVSSLFAVALLAASALFAQTTGRIEGRIRDDAGAAVPGVAVVATAETLPGEVRTVTDQEGMFRLVKLPPGVYQLKAELDGFNSVEQRDIKVGIDRTVTLDITITAAFAGELTVLSEAPVVDTTSVTSGVSVSSDTFEQLPLARDFYAVAQIASGSGRDGSGTTFYGSTGAENQYVIEGLNTTGGRFGDEGKTLNFDFIQEVEVKTGGLPAEYGRLTGGLINAITKSGGNNFEGSVFGFFEGGGLQSDNSTGPDTPDTVAAINNVDGQYDYGFTLGGAFVTDKLWYFAAYNRQNVTNQTSVIRPIAPVLGFGDPPPTGSTFDADTTSDLYSGKLTWRLTNSQNLAVSVIGDPRTTDGVVFPVAGPESTFQGEFETGSDDFVARYDGVFGGSWVVEGLAGLHQESSRTTGPGKEIPLYIDRRGARPYPNAGGFGFHQDDDVERQVFKLDVSKFVGSSLELKFGADQEDLSITSRIFNGGAGQRIYIFNNANDPNGPPVYRHRFYVDDRSPGFDRDDASTWQLLFPLVAEPETVNTSAYAQASWKVLPNFTVNAGFRWEAQDVKDRDGNSSIKIDDNYAPRLQMIWDPNADGRSKLFGSFGRYYESVPLDINVRAFGGENQCFCYNYSPDPRDFQPIPDDESGFGTALLGGATPVDPDLKGQYIDEYMIGYEYEVRPNFALGIQGTYRELGRVIEDFLIISEGNYFIANPGEGIGSVATFYDYAEVPAEKPRREYTGVELTARKRYSDGWQLYASYLWSTSRGQLRRRLPGLDRPARPEHQLGVRLRRLPDQRRRRSVQRPRAQLQGQRQLHGPGGRARQPDGRPGGLLAQWHAAHRVRLLVRLQQLGVLPDAARLARPQPERVRGGSPPQLSAPARPGRAPAPARRLQPAGPPGDHHLRPALQPGDGRLRRHPRRAVQRRRRPAARRRDARPDRTARQPARDRDQPRLPPPGHRVHRPALDPRRTALPLLSPPVAGATRDPPQHRGPRSGGALSFTPTRGGAGHPLPCRGRRVVPGRSWRRMRTAP